VKIFESAFGRRDGKLIPSLEKFLNKSPVRDLRYPKTEIRGWLNMRGMDAHACREIADFSRIEYDPTMFRLRQAAIDVAYNKANWGSNLPIRNNRELITAYYDCKGLPHLLAGARLGWVLQRDMLGYKIIDRTLNDNDRMQIQRTAYSLAHKIALLDCEDLLEIPIPDNGEHIELTKPNDATGGRIEKITWEFTHPFIKTD
jgi:hypothetical protein